MRALSLALLAIVATGCVGPQDDPTNVKDLRVLAMRFEPSEVMIPGCNPQLLLNAASLLDGGLSADGGGIPIPPELAFRFLAAATTPLTFTTHYADPAGNGRALDYRVLACANRGDRQCDDEGDYVELNTGVTDGGDIEMILRPGAALLDGGTTEDGGINASPLIFEVIQQDTFKGLGGIRVPVVLELSAADTQEKIYAQKLMVYTCQFFPSMKQNVTPLLPGIQVDGEVWPEGEVKNFTGKDEHTFTPVDFDELQEVYVVPTLELKPFELTESWKVTWMTTSGTFGTYTTGGTNISGETGRQRSKWRPDQVATTATDVEFTFVVRDGRGGNSWLTRRAHWSP